ncbi:hypothetical protein ASE00_12080 [Sphingomonas sp. Root710]|uniref:hypothetical protein n=1 Tax=Sphingomonas sp. Root710 TaxID=1736594 RepID=UPI0006F255C8|nr:hypothetical protein [Sphingomonas sp. Root710]KRB82759.1 hypothetical protein ASE00_12080 [Sphingomonas sp. Root710]
MSTNDTTNRPGLFKPALLFAAAAALVALSTRAPAQELSPAPRAYAGEAKVRIRGVGAAGLDAVAFADWMAVHRDIRSLRSAALFVQADANRDSRVSPVELKDLLVSLGDGDA